MFQIDPRVTLG